MFCLDWHLPKERHGSRWGVRFYMEIKVGNCMRGVWCHYQWHLVVCPGIWQEKPETTGHGSSGLSSVSPEDRDIYKVICDCLNLMWHDDATEKQRFHYSINNKSYLFHFTYVTIFCLWPTRSTFNCFKAVKSFEMEYPIKKFPKEHFVPYGLKLQFLYQELKSIFPVT